MAILGQTAVGGPFIFTPPAAAPGGGGGSTRGRFGFSLLARLHFVLPLLVRLGL